MRFAWVVLAGLAANIGSAAAAPDPYSLFLSRFWIGDAPSGHLAVSTKRPEDPPPKGWLWQFAEGWNPIYAQWRIAGDADAKARLGAEWNWVRRHWSLKDLSRCGEVGDQTATTQDDSSWVVMGLAQLHAATGDRAALDYARAAADCALKRWGDDALGGGLWYDDAHKPNTGKQVSNGNFALGLIAIYEASCNLGGCEPRWLDKAKAIEAWAAAKLRRPDGLYWMGVDPRGRPLDGDRPNDIAPAASVVALFGDMGFAALDARLFGITKKPEYQARAGETAQAILARESRGGAFMDDRDARGNGYAAYDYAEAVLPLLPDKGPQIAAFQTTAAQVAAAGDLGGDWGAKGEKRWQAAGFGGDKLEIAANAAIWAVVARMFGGAK